jgi:hypothetical protein
MTYADNPYQAPEARREQFSVQWRRPMVYTVAGSLCWFFAATLVVGICYNIPLLIQIGAKPGWSNFLATKFGREMMIGLAGAVVAIPILVIIGQSFFKGRGRRGLFLGFLAYVVAQLIRFLLVGVR